VWIPPKALGPFTLCSVPEDVMQHLWPLCSVQELLQLAMTSRACATDVQHKLLTLERLPELWSGAALAGHCLDAFAAQEDSLPQPKSKARALGDHAGKVLSEGVCWILETRLTLPRSRVLFRFFTTGSGVRVCNVRRVALQQGVECYMVHACNADVSRELFLHVFLLAEAETESPVSKPPGHAPRRCPSRRRRRARGARAKGTSSSGHMVML